MKRSPDWRGHEQAPRNHKPLEPGSVHGALTVLHLSAGDGRLTVFRCMCGARVIRGQTSVRNSLKLGRVPACPECTEEAKRQLRLAAERNKEAG